METQLATQDQTKLILPAQKEAFLTSLTLRPELAAVHQALQSRKISELGDRSIGQLVIQVAFINGCGEPKSEPEKEIDLMRITIAYIRENFGKYREAELIHAHDMNIKGQFPGIREAFNNISPKFLQAVMNDYETYLKQEYWKKWKEFNQVEAELPENQKRELERKWNKRMYDECEAVKSRQKSEVNYPSQVYDYLVKSAQLNLSVPEKKVLFERAKEIRITELKKESTDIMKSFAERQQAVRILKDYEAGKKEMDKPAVTLIAKTLSVKEYLSK